MRRVSVSRLTAASRGRCLTTIRGVPERMAVRLGGKKTTIKKLKEMASMESISFSNDLDKRARSPEYRRWEERKANMIKNSFYSNKGRRWYSNASKGDTAETSEADAYMASLEAEVGA